MPTIISKSKYLSGIQCDKLLWTYYNQKQLIPPTDARTQWIFDQGHEVGKLAQQLVPGGVEVPSGTMEETVAATQRLLALRKPIYEASFLADGVYCRVDILQPVEGDAWDVLEVKSSNSAKCVNAFDLVVQRHALLASGLRIRRLFLVHLNAEYVRRGEISVSELFKADDMTREVERLAASVPLELARQRAVIAGEDPRTPIGRQCDTPYTCPLKPHCWAFLPEDSVTTLHRAGQNAFRLLRNGILHALEVPEAELSAQQQIQQRALRENRVQLNVARLRQWLDALAYPCLLLDFEAFVSAIPRHDGTSPHQHVPFQVSVHRLDAPGAEASHLEFLAEQPADPRPQLAAFLASLPSAGSVLAYHKSYEAGILERLGAGNPRASSGARQSAPSTRRSRGSLSSLRLPSSPAARAHLAQGRAAGVDRTELRGRRDRRWEYGLPGICARRVRRRGPEPETARARAAAAVLPEGHVGDGGDSESARGGVREGGGGVTIQYLQGRPWSEWTSSGLRSLRPVQASGPTPSGSCPASPSVRSDRR